MVWWWLIGIAAAILVASIALSDIWDWFEENEEVDSSYGEIIRKKIDDGEYQVVAGVFDRHGNCTAKQAWEGELDDDLKEAFGRRNKITVDL